MEKVCVLDPTYENETGIIQSVSSNEGYPIAKIKLDSTGECIFCFLEEIEIIG